MAEKQKITTKTQIQKKKNANSNLYFKVICDTVQCLQTMKLASRPYSFGHNNNERIPSVEKNRSSHYSRQRYLLTFTERQHKPM